MDTDQLRQSIIAAEELRRKLPELRQDGSREGMMKYNHALLEATTRQHNIYARLRLMGDRESVQTADEMEKVSVEHMGKDPDMSMDNFFKTMQNEIRWQLGFLSGNPHELSEDEK